MQEIAEVLGVSRQVADGLVKFLVEVGAARFCGQRPSQWGRGRGSNVYEVGDGAAKKAAAVVVRLET